MLCRKRSTVTCALESIVFLGRVIKQTKIATGKCVWKKDVLLFAAILSTLPSR